VKGLSLCVGARGEGGIGSWVLQGVQNVLKATEDDVSRGAVRELDFTGEPSERIDDTESSCFPDPDVVAPI
jgi:hypothetical protein